VESMLSTSKYDDEKGDYFAPFDSALRFNSGQAQGERLGALRATDYKMDSRQGHSQIKTICGDLGVASRDVLIIPSNSPLRKGRIDRVFPLTLVLEILDRGILGNDFRSRNCFAESTLSESLGPQITI
jgi:hypothetical protein